MNNKYKEIFKPFTFPCGVELASRVVMSPMTTWSGEVDGNVSDAELKYYNRRAEGLGAVITACTHVTENGQGFDREFAAYSDDFIPSLAKVADAIQEKGTKAILQIFHAGRLAPPELLPDGQPVGVSALGTGQENSVVPKELTEEEITSIIKAFGEATRRAIVAGFDGIEIHGANHYLFQQFFSPYSNIRTDRYGGTVENRMTFSLEVIKEVQETVKKHTNKPFIIGYRLSPEEREAGGITIEDTLLFVDKLADSGIDYIHISLMNFFGGSICTEDKTSIMKLINERVGNRIPLIGVGYLHTADDALLALQTGIPLIALGRELIMEPDWIKKVKTGEEASIRTTIQSNSKEELVVPDQLWERIVKTKGWFPVVE